MTPNLIEAMARAGKRLGEIFSPRVTVTKHYSVRPMTAAEQEAFDRAFTSMDTAFAEMDKAFQSISQGGATS